MKRCWICLCTSFALCGVLQAQQDIQAMLKQIAKLQVYIVDAEKGYQIAQGGLTTIGDIKNGEFDLHSLFFSSLESVNPHIMSYSKVTGIATVIGDIVRQFSMLLNNMHTSPLLTGNQISFIIQVYDNMMAACNQIATEMLTILTDGQLEMTDDERIARIDHMYSDATDKYAFTVNFTKETQAIMRETGRYQNENNLLKELE